MLAQPGHMSPHVLAAELFLWPSGSLENMSDITVEGAPVGVCHGNYVLLAPENFCSPSQVQ